MQFQGYENHVKQIIYLSCYARNYDTNKRVIHTKFCAEPVLPSLITDAILRRRPSPLTLAVLSIKWQLVFKPRRYHILQ